VKASIYIPDDLWQKAQAIEGFKLSAFVQEAMRERFDRQRPYRQLDEDLVAWKEEAAETLVKEMTRAYRWGYKLGLAIAPQLPWEAFVDLEGNRWNVAAWRSDFDESMYRIVDEDSWDVEDEDEEPGGERYLDFDQLIELGRDELRNEVFEFPGNAFDDSNVPSGIIGEGFVDALRAVWTESPSPGSAAGVAHETNEDPPSGEDRS
jgi:hypothetical protein